MDPFGNFGWDFGFGFGWILIGVFALLMVLAIVQLGRLAFKEEQGRREMQAQVDSLKQDLCANKITLEELQDRLKNAA